MASTFWPSQVITLQAPDIKPGEWYSVKVLSVDEDRHLEISVPIAQSREVVIPPSYKVMLEVIRPDGVRRMTAHVESRRTSSPPVLVLDWPEVDERIQRRDSVRVAVSFPVFVRPFNAAGKLGSRVNGTVVDLSAGGVQARVPVRLWEGLAVELALQIPVFGERICGGTIVRSTINDNAAEASQYIVGVRFTDITEAVRRDITKFVFDTQIEYLRKGIL